MSPDQKLHYQAKKAIKYFSKAQDDPVAQAK